MNSIGACRQGRAHAVLPWQSASPRRVCPRRTCPRGGTWPTSPDPSDFHDWKEHYDVAERLRRHWPELRRDLDGRIHLTVGTADNFHLDGSAHRLEATMMELGAKTDFRYVEGRGHFDLYAIGDDPQGLYRKLAWEMYAVARPGATRGRVGATSRQAPPAVAPRLRQQEW